MIIANPIYDTTFKKLMEKTSVAKTLIGTILDCEILSLTKAPTEQMHEPIYQTQPTTIYRLDYVAVIETKNKENKKVLIEVQKCFHKSDIARFHKYLGSEYIKTDLHIITIYILGFKLKVSSPAFVAPADCHDIRTKEPVPREDDIVKGLTHTAYFIQTPRITPCEDTILDQLLSLFEQKNFINGGEYLKALSISKISPQLKEIVDILASVANNKELTAELAQEYALKRNYDRYIGSTILEIAEKDKVIEEKEKTIEDNEKTIKVLEQKDKALNTTILNLKQAGMSLEKISEMTGLTVKEIDKIINNP